MQAISKEGAVPQKGKKKNLPIWYLSTYHCREYELIIFLLLIIMESSDAFHPFPARLPPGISTVASAPLVILSKLPSGSGLA
jgi:hypothetical protein